jgi:LPXTG-site transpeptidase (sortase) family protein
VASLKIALVVTTAVLAAGCGGTTAGSAGAEVTPPPASAAASVSGSTELPSVRIGTPAASQRIRFVPSVLELPGGHTAPVDPASTVGGQLVVPENVRRVGWWDGGAQAGDPFGALVIAGHIDSATEGLGFFVQLLAVQTGEVVTVANVGHRASYKVVSVRSVPKNALATGTFDQTGPHRLVLITCTGRYDRARGGYERNLVLTAIPTGSIS